jgi:hypothetical protein
MRQNFQEIESSWGDNYSSYQELGKVNIPVLLEQIAQKVV